VYQSGDDELKWSVQMSGNGVSVWALEIWNRSSYKKELASHVRYKYEYNTRMVCFASAYMDVDFVWIS